MGIFKKKQKNNGKPRAVVPKEAVGGIDKPFLILVFLLLGIGLVMVASSSYVSAYYSKGDSYYFIKRQLIFAVLGIIFMFI